MISGRALWFLVGILALLALASAVAYCADPFLIPGIINKPMPVLKEDCIKFNPDQVEAKQINGNWKVVQGSMWMLDFGSSEENAKKAVDIIKHYKMDSQCFVGRPNAPMQYYLVNGKSPVGSFAGEDAIPFNPSSTEVKQVSGTWKVVDGSHSMLDFGDNQAEANKALSIIKKYGFTHICFVGRPNAPMMYFRKDLPKLIGPIGTIHPIAPKEDCIKFDPDQVEAKQINGNWKVVQGSMWMLDFGGNEAEAKKAVDVIKFYKMDSQCFVGRPNAPMQYYLVGGKAPVGPFAGEDALDFNPKTTEVKQFGSSWKVVDGNHAMLDFGGNQAEAEQALSIIKKHGFTHICFVGRPNAPMMYFRKDKGLKLPGQIVGPVKPPLNPSSSIHVQLIADPKQYHGKYPVTIKFKGKITADEACEIQYIFTRSDGATDQVKTLKFKHAGTENVEDTWTLSKDFEGWETLKILSPVEVESAKAEFKLSHLKPLKPGLILNP